MNCTIKMNLEDRIYGTMNNGKRMPKGLMFFYSVLTKHWWIAYTDKYNNENEFNDKTAWVNALRRLKIALHAFEIESRLRFEQLKRNLHPLLGHHPAKLQKACEHEIERRNKKIHPLGEISLEGDVVTLERAFLWKDTVQLLEED